MDIYAYRRPRAAGRWTPLLASLAPLGLAVCLLSMAAAGEIQLLRLNPDPYGYPRPFPGEANVPTATSFFVEIGFSDKNSTDTIRADTVAARIGPQGEPAVQMLKPGMRFADGFSGKILPLSNQGQAPRIALYIDPGAELKPSTTYTVTVGARSRDGAVLDAAAGSWQFTTEDAATTHALSFPLDLSTPPVRWRGGFFIGFCKPSFCTSASNRFPEFELMDRFRKESPKAWSLQRDFALTNMERQPEFLSGGQPNIVRERETRRIAAMEKRPDGTLLRVEDFFGCEQYGIAPNRHLAGDYRAGDEVLIADGIHSARTKVKAIVDDGAEVRSLLVAPFDEPAGGWRIDYAAPLPKKEDPNAPGLFPPGGCYVIKFQPVGTPHYYWGRVDREFDIAHQFHRRLEVNFTDAPGDLAVDGRNWTFPKDYPPSSVAAAIGSNCRSSTITRSTPFSAPSRTTTTIPTA
ncbi:MAG: Ig-like domain-containing protein [Candidatus Sumerlaeota bacterium]|nr:Ig-like domain-containing protein [Candidatus Sumerlaeota bacterium]